MSEEIQLFEILPFELYVVVAVGVFITLLIAQKWHHDREFPAHSWDPIDSMLSLLVALIVALFWPLVAVVVPMMVALIPLLMVSHMMIKRMDFSRDT